MEPVTSVLVLLSGGQDSTTCLAWARDTYPGATLHALTAFYAQRHEAEVAAAVDIADLLGCASHTIVDLSGALGASNSALLAASDDTLRGSGGIPDAQMPQGLPTSFVPGRNMVFLAVAAAHAAARGCQRIVTGVCQTDYSGYPDCREPFVRAMQAAIWQAMPSGQPLISIDTPLMRLTKAETVALMVGLARKEAREGSVNRGDWRATTTWRALGRSVTCYHGQHPGCGTCPSCELRVKGFAEAGSVDPSTEAGS